MTSPPTLLPRAGVVVVLVPLPAAAVVAAVLRSVVRAFFFDVALAPSDREVGIPLACLVALPLVAILVRSARVWAGAPSQLGWAFRAAPLVAVAGALIGAFAGPG